jgi:hypothetical protein
LQIIHAIGSLALAEENLIPAKLKHGFSVPDPGQEFVRIEWGDNRCFHA